MNVSLTKSFNHELIRKLNPSLAESNKIYRLLSIDKDLKTLYTVIIGKIFCKLFVLFQNCQHYICYMILKCPSNAKNCIYRWTSNL